MRDDRLESPGAPRQIIMESSPATQGRYEFHFPLRGVINEVYMKDNPLNKQGETVVDIFILDGYPPAFKVPFAYKYANSLEGEDDSPKKGDIVLVQFIGGNVLLPVVTGYLTPPKQELTALTEDYPRSYRSRNGTTETIDKEGNRSIFVAKDDTLEIAGNGTVTITEGNRSIFVAKDDTLEIAGDGTVTITGGDLIIEVQTGGATISVKGDVNIVVEGTLTADVTGETSITTPTATLTGDLVVEGDITAAGDVMDQGGTKSMAGMRAVFNTHVHGDPQGGSVTATVTPM